MRRRLAKILPVFLVLLLGAGCGLEKDKSQSTPAKQSEDWVDSMESAPVLDYEVPTLMPGVLVPSDGYPTEGEKMVIFQGDNPGTVFLVINAETGETVYTGKVEKGQYETQWNTYISYGDFSSLETEGEFYIECSNIGKSEIFPLVEEYYSKLQEEVLQNLVQLQQERTLEGEEIAPETLILCCKELSALLLSVELFPDSQEDGVLEEENEIPDILEYVARQIARLSTWQDKDSGGVGEATPWYCATLAKFSYTYQKYDSTYATSTLQAADKAWKYLLKMEDVEEEEQFYAATELYRATGKYTYHSLAKSLGKSLTPDTGREALTYGGITYLSTRRSVDTDICSAFLDDLMNTAEKIALTSRENPFLVEENLEVGREDIFLSHVLTMAVVDYVITNHEYATLIENHHYYFTGRNHQGISYLEQNSFAENPQVLAKYYLLLSESKTHER